MKKLLMLALVFTISYGASAQRNEDDGDNTAQSSYGLFASLAQSWSFHSAIFHFFTLFISIHLSTCFSHSCLFTNAISMYT